MFKTMKKIMTVAVAMSMMMAGVTACGSNSSESESVSSSSKAGDKVYKIATDVAFKPFSYSDEAGNQIGFDIDLFKAIAEDQGIKYEFQPLGFESACAALETGQADGAICCLNIKEERKLKYDFSDPYYTSSVVVMVKEDSPYTQFSDFSGKKIGAKIATDAERYASDIEEQSGSETVGIEDFVTGMMMLDSGSLDAVVDDVTVVTMAIAEKGGYKIIGEPGYEANVGFAVPKGKNPELIEAFNEGLKNVQNNGKYDEIKKQHIG